MAEAGLSGTVAAALRRVGPDPVSVSDLVDAVLDSHRSDYLAGWSRTPPAWPADSLRQTTARWEEELRQVVRGDLVFGRIAIIGWCLLVDEVAAVAVSSGLLGGLAHEVEPDLAHFMAPTGMRLLRTRAPLVALGVGELPAIVDRRFSEEPVDTTLVALPRQPRGSGRGIGNWAVAPGTQVYAGRGGTSAPVLEPTTTPVTAIGWSRQGHLHILLGEAGLARYDPTTSLLTPSTDWPTTALAAIDERAIAAVTHGPPEEVVWGTTDGGGPVTLQAVGSPTAIAVADELVAVLAERGHVLNLGGTPDDPWWQEKLEAPGRSLFASAQEVIVGGDAGQLRRFPWPAGHGEGDGHPGEVGNGTTQQHLDLAIDQTIVHLVGAAGWVVAASTQEATILSGKAVVTRWRPPDGNRITGVAMSPDGAAIAIADDTRLRIWRIDATSDLRLTSYTADTPDGDDLLGVQPTVDALAAIVAARAVEPPLSIGLFGAWGSGKTWFMRQLEERVTTVTREARTSGRPQAALWAWRNIRHVQFNAWHYAAADVWAGMLEQLIHELVKPAAGADELDLPEELSELAAARIARLTGAAAGAEVAKAALEAAGQHLEDARTAVEDASNALDEARTKARAARARSTRELLGKDVVAALDEALDAAGLPELGRSVDRTLRDIADARRSVTDIAGLTARDGHGWLLAAVVAGPVLGVVTAFVLGSVRPEAASGAWGLVVAFTTSIAAGARWLRGALSWMKARLELLQHAEDEARRTQEAADEAIRAAQEDVLSAEARVERAERDRSMATQELGLAEASVAAISPGNLLMEYLEGRDRSKDYRDLLGVIGTVRRDLDVIWGALERHNQLLADDPGAAGDEVVNRVVLYVDDLDRCRPDVVVKVLEAVSMLLSFPMFVVVVAVDAHWISKSLATVYPSLLTGGDVTPDNYLEKIFQLPVWLERPAPEAATTMARTLLGGGPQEPGNDRGLAGSGPTTTDAGPDAASDDTTGGTSDEASGVAGAARPGGPGGDREREAQRNIALATTPPASIELAVSERTAIGDLAPLLSRSPRALKRFLNTYRLLKALIDVDDLEHARLLLAVATGRPDLGERLLAAIATGPAERSLADVVATWHAAERAWLEQGVPSGLSWQDLTCGRLEPAARQVRRFIFHAGATQDRQPARHVVPTVGS